MIFNEGDSSGGPHAHEARGAPLPIYQPPVLTPTHCLLQNACNTHRRIFCEDMPIETPVQCFPEDAQEVHVRCRCLMCVSRYPKQSEWSDPSLHYTCCIALQSAAGKNRHMCKCCHMHAWHLFALSTHSNGCWSLRRALYTPVEDSSFWSYRCCSNKCCYQCVPLKYVAQTRLNSKQRTLACLSS